VDHFSREFLPCTRAPIARHHAAGKQDDLTLHLISRNPISHPGRGTCAAAAAAGNKLLLPPPPRLISPAPSRHFVLLLPLLWQN